MTARRNPFSAALMLHMALLAFPSGSSAQEPQPVPLRFGSHATFQRMVLDWPRTVAYFVEQSDRSATLIFETPAAFRSAQIASGLAQLATGVTAASDGRTSRISFELAEGIELRHFRADTKIVIDLVHGGRVPRISPAAGAKPGADGSTALGAGGRPWERLPLSGAATRTPVWVEAPRALAPPPAPTIPARRPEPRPAEPQPDRKAATAEPSPTATVAPLASAAPVRLAAPPPAKPISTAAASSPSVPAPPWRQAVREAACRGDLERATAILAERMAASPLDPIDWYNLTWLLRTLAGATMEPPPKPADSAVYDAPLVGLCSGKPVAGTVATWQRLAYAGRFTEFLIDLAPASDPGRR